MRFILKRRLPLKDRADHMRYIELESARIVETLRCLRDEYRKYLEKQGCTPLAEMYWVVVRYGVKDWAIMVLRSAAFDYVVASKVSTDQWKGLFDFSGPFNDFMQEGEPAEAASVIVKANEDLRNTIKALLPQSALDQILVGGPFGRDYQIYLARGFPGRAFLSGKESFQGAIDRRLASWDAAQPWTEGLARLFDAAQEEISFQYDALGHDGREAEAKFVHLPEFDRIAHKHLMILAPGPIADEAAARYRWPALMHELDEAGIIPEKTLEGIARKTLMASLRKNVKVTNWQECYASKVRVSLEDGVTRTLRREVMHAIHNAAKKAAYQLEKVWSGRTKPRKITKNPDPPSRKN